jgi:hypothetical protein
MLSDPRGEKTPVLPAGIMMYQCRCFQVGSGAGLVYQKYVLDPKKGTYGNPTPCTQQECRECNQSLAVPVGV